MITYVMGDLFQSPAKVLVNPVNTVGVMGKGLGAEFKRFYPEMFDQYRVLCETGRFRVGQLHVYRTAHKWALNFPVKRHWRDAAQLSDIEASLQKFAAVYAEHGMTSVSFPMLSMGESKLNWQSEMRPLMEAYLQPLPIAVYIHVFDEATLNRNTRSVAAWLHGTPQPIAFDKLWRDLLRLIKRKTDFVTADGTPFSVTQDEKARSRSVVLVKAGDSTYLSESLLADLWHYLRGAGYAQADNMPSGLDGCADCLLALLGELDYLDTVALSASSRDDGEAPRTGLHYIPPTRKDEPRIAQLALRSDV
ncbi:MAG: macro domain-containing protein [Armatimonadetes bacterium]|nr:macro domain-containing protein [Anaerolineae bacterium]